jgi:hypothetical protein
MNYRQNRQRRDKGFPQRPPKATARHFVEQAATLAMIERDAARVRLAEYLGVSVTSVPVDVPLGCDPAKSYALLLEGHRAPIAVHYKASRKTIQKDASA